MTTSFYLEHYLDSLESLPGELRRNFTLMHDMDDKNRNILRDVDAASDDYLRKVSFLCCWFCLKFPICWFSTPNPKYVIHWPL